MIFNFQLNHINLNQDLNLVIQLRSWYIQFFGIESNWNLNFVSLNKYKNVRIKYLNSYFDLNVIQMENADDIILITLSIIRWNLLEMNFFWISIFL